MDSHQVIEEPLAELALASMWWAAFGLNSYVALLVRRKRLEVKKIIVEQHGRPLRDYTYLGWMS